MSVVFDAVWPVLLIGAARAVAARVLAVPVRLVTALLSGLTRVAIGVGIQVAVAGEWKGAAPDVLFACSSAFAAVAVVSVLSLLGAAPNVEFDAGAASLGPPRSPWRAVGDFLARCRAMCSCCGWRSAAGAAWTPGTAQLTPEAVPAWKYVWPLVRFFQRRGSSAKAAQSPRWLAASSEAEGLTGTYLEKRKQQRPKVAADPDNQRRVIEFAHALVSQAPTAPRSHNP